jgi:hypothetical protein
MVNIWEEETTEETFHPKVAEDGEVEVHAGTLNQLVRHLTNAETYRM